MIGYKGFDKHFRCRDMQYEVGKTYHHDGELIICESGLHFCKNPLAVFEYYRHADSRYALVDATGNVVKCDDKYCTDELKIVRELTLAELIAAVPDENKSTNTDFCSVATNTRDYSMATNTGDWSTATTTGDWSIATNTGDRSVATVTGCSVATNTGNHSVATATGNCSAIKAEGFFSIAATTGFFSTSEVTGKHSLAVATGFNSVAKGALGCWLVLGEWRDDELADVQIFKVDGLHVKPDTFYKLQFGQLTEVQS